MRNPVRSICRKIVCPICWRQCRLFLRMQDLKFTDSERSKFIYAFHRDVCPLCKRLNCKPPGPSDECIEVRKLNTKKFAIPAWWNKTMEHN